MPCLAAICFSRSAGIFLFVAGSALFVVNARQVIDSRIAEEHVGESLMANVQVAAFPQAREANVTFLAIVDDSPWIPRRIRVTWHAPDSEIRVGDIWRLELRLRRPRASSNPGAYDQEAWLFRQQIAATAYVVPSHRNERLARANGQSLALYRQTVVDRLLATVEHPERAAVLAALSVGARHLMTSQQWDRYAGTGTSHLMAISGLHVGMVAGVAYLLAAVVSAVLGRSANQHRTGTVMAVIAAFGYALISGLAVPAQRATLMIALAGFAVLSAREARPFRIIALTSVLIAAVDPLATMSPGYLLSFLAVLVLLWIARTNQGAKETSGFSRPWRGAVQLMRVQWALLIGLMPMTILLFERVAIAAPAVNLLAVPLFGFVTVPMTLTGAILGGSADNFGRMALSLASNSLDVVEALIAIGLRIPTSQIVVDRSDVWLLVTVFLPTAWILLPAGWPVRALAIVAAVSLMSDKSDRPDTGCAEITVLDVGQGLAVSVLTRNSALLYDTGPAFFSGGNAARSTVVPFLQRSGVSELDNLVVSHTDLDHAGGLAEILGQFRAHRVFLGEEAGDPALAYSCVAGIAWTTDGISFEFLHPEATVKWTGNDASCVLQISAGSFSVLLSGDIESAAEEALVESGAAEPVDVVIVPHHGSKTSSTRAFVESLQPRLAIVSSGFGNRWGQPATEVVDRWRAVGATVLNTARDGAISFSICERGGVSGLVRARQERRRIWHE